MESEVEYLSRVAEENLSGVLTELFRERRPAVVYHYTAPPGLMGIVTDRAIRATDVRYSNDARESEVAREIALVQLAQHLEQADDNDRPIVQECSGGLSNQEDIAVYAASFSAVPDQLSQWRAYGSASGGFSIGFDADTITKTTGAALYPCIYARARQEELVGKAIGGVLKAWRGAPKQLGIARSDPVLKALGRFFLREIVILGAVFKAPGFHEEEEWRITTDSHRDQALTPDFREGRSGLVPFVKFKLAPEGGPLEIAKVVVGPNPHPGLAIRSASQFLEVRKVKVQEVVASDVPYRSW